jgi:hypothetical protein
MHDKIPTPRTDYLTPLTPGSIWFSRIAWKSSARRGRSQAFDLMRLDGAQGRN